MKFVFFGTRELGAIVLKHLLSHGYSPSLVVTGPDKPAGRKQKLTPSPVKACILKHETWNLKLLQPEELDSRFTLYVSSFKPDLIVVAAYGKILPKDILDIPVHGALNVHPSLLPLYRGPSPERGALLNGDEKTGVTVILMDEKADHGPILAQEEFAIPENMRHEELHAKLGEIGGELLVKTIPQWLQGKITPKEQDHSRATYTKKLTKEDGRIDWNKSAEYIERQVRAFYPWPGTFTSFKAKRQKTKDKITIQNLKILKASVLLNIEGEAGRTFLAHGDTIGVYTGIDALLIDELQLEGGKPMSSKEFLLGHRDFIGYVFAAFA